MLKAVANDTEHQSALGKVRSTLTRVIRGKEEAVELLLVGVLAGGHVLMEDVPGVGKTTLAKALAAALGLEFARVQFTPDLLPSDILGSQILRPADGVIEFQRGPVFTQVLLADEINRASPRTQSALLEAMSERQVSVDGQALALPSPFMVIATQNPVDFHGTFPLPEAQLDRFVLRLSLGYPAPEQERALLRDRHEGDPLDSVRSVVSEAQWIDLAEKAARVHVSEAVLSYVQELAAWTRQNPEISLGVSPRGTLTLYRAAQALALLCGRDYATPDDVQRVATSVIAHRLRLSAQAKRSGSSPESLCQNALDAVAVPV